MPLAIPFNRQADKQNFLVCNRIVAGRTLGSVVVEARLTIVWLGFALTDGGRKTHDFLPSKLLNI